MGFTIRELALTAVFTALTAILAQITIPMVPVPFSFGVFGALLAGSILPLKLAVSSQIVYLLLGTVGAPVFSGFSGGFQRVIGPSGGYLVGYVLIALVLGLLYSKWDTPPLWGAVLISLCGSLSCLVCGAMWLGLSQGYTLTQTIVSGLLIFLPMDAIKAAMAAMVGLRLRATLHRAHLLV